MLLSTMRWGATQLLILMVFLTNCGGDTKRGLQDSPGDAAVPDATTTAAGGTAAVPDAEPDVELDAGMDAPVDVVSDYVDPGCPDAEPPPPMMECDPLATPSGCEPGLACYPFVRRPDGDGCEFERFGANCLPPGTVQTGERCGNDFGWCDAGLLCVVGALAGARCLKLCDPFLPNSCPGGLVCAAVDIEGYGVCG
jgi:hypothetical protein